ncbi:unnamed protein product [Spirodela intermedia]|uniref:J domain-containing protein n=1 Tax=Spirodela intermedia TaxID=51605 RepID=A0ABN7E865_SPIIN|nr:unnamed protein product [Spirodela intermedia]
MELKRTFQFHQSQESILLATYSLNILIIHYPVNENNRHLCSRIFATIILWIYGSFWTTGFVIFVGGISFATNHERVSLFIATGYAVYSAKGYIGWPGLILGFNLAFFSGDDDQRSNRPEQAWQSHGRTDHHSNGELGKILLLMMLLLGTQTVALERIMRLLNCNDHYSALGLARYETIDASYLKREYRKKAMLVHPDKNMGNEKAAEAFKKLQNAYEVFFETKTYDDELRREELLNYIRRLQTTSKSGKHGIFTTSGSVHPRPEEEAASLGDSRRITCKKCGDFHLWAQASRSKSRARWCQLHPAKDGDGWVEQSFQPSYSDSSSENVWLHRRHNSPSMSPPIAYVCADSRIYDATEWFLCQLPVNTQPSFHVNTSVASRHGTARPGPTEQTMTEEEFFEWLQSAVQSGAFDGPIDSDAPPLPGPHQQRQRQRQWLQEQPKEEEEGKEAVVTGTTPSLEEEGRRSSSENFIPI